MAPRFTNSPSTYTDDIDDEKINRLLEEDEHLMVLACILGDVDSLSLCSGE